VTPVFGPVADGVEVSRRMGAGKQVFVLINYSQETRQVTLPHAMKSLLEDRQADTLDLPPYGVAVLLDSK
jgi:beta-galactosidase